MSDRFWKTKIHTLIKSINLEQIREIIENDSNKDRATIYLDALEIVLAQSSNDTAIVNASELAQQINEASDRAIFNRIPIEDNSEPYTVKHLLSGAKLDLGSESTKIKKSPDTQPEIDSEKAGQVLPCSLQELFWWLWRCLPEAIVKQQGANSLLIPASDNLPDASIWSDASLSAALAGALVGYENETESRPQLVIFSFSPIQELIKASRKMRDFWAGSWLLHYLSAKVCWNIAKKYGPDSLVYPSLYQQPLIDRWLLDNDWLTKQNKEQNKERERTPDFSSWIDDPSNRSLLTAGFPNVIVVVLPKGEVKGAMQQAHQNLLKEWIDISDRVFNKLKLWEWMPELDKNDPTWNGWLKAQWQTYWTALPLGKEDLKQEKLPLLDELNNDWDKITNDWVKSQNKACNLPLETTSDTKDKPLFLDREKEFINQVKETIDKNASVNVGSWWPYTFDQLRFALSSVKKARTWTIPTAFTMRSTISGMGSVVTPKSSDFRRQEESENHTTREDLQTRHESWNSIKGVFDGKEQLNATETVKRGLHFVLADLLFKPDATTERDEQTNNENKYVEKISASYPDLCSGVAGWLQTNKDNREIQQYYSNSCQQIVDKFSWTTNYRNYTKPTALMPWGIPLIDGIDEEGQNVPSHQKYNPRLLNAGWAIEDYPMPKHFSNDKEKAEAKKNKQDELIKFKKEIDSLFAPGNNPTDWYVIAVGDGDGMGEWLKGSKLENYEQYLGDALLNNPLNAIAKSIEEEKRKKITESLEALKKIGKRMGPSTHNALSRALLDFSNRLVPYITEERYAGRLIYSGGDDVFAYTNLWEWDKWLWDVRQCFCGADDPHQKFGNAGDYWQWKETDKPDSLPNRPLFTMGSKASISFGLVIAHHSVPLAIALENAWKAEEGAKDHLTIINGENKPKDAVQVRVLFGNGNMLSATGKFEVFHHWQELLETVQKLKGNESNSIPALLEQAAQTWKDYPAPLNNDSAIAAWTKAFCTRREILNNKASISQDFSTKLQKYLVKIIAQTQPEDCDREIQNWLKLGAFVLRNRDIKLKQPK